MAGNRREVGTTEAKYPKEGTMVGGVGILGLQDRTDIAGNVGKKAKHRRKGGMIVKIWRIQNRNKQCSSLTVVELSSGEWIIKIIDTRSKGKRTSRWEKSQVV